MKNILMFSALLFFQTGAAGEPIKQVTVNDLLPQAKQKAIEQGRSANRLINESSPYLLQHAYNPVDWHAWGEEAFAKAKKQNKPIFLSIGYSTCHWCHVMAHESFENKEIAALLNKYFISIKVDREQRPDIDAVYMSATQLINGHGGWPMSVFLDHELRPFHAATYYPPFSTEKSLGFNELLLRINDLWLHKPELVNKTAILVTERITALSDEATGRGILAGDAAETALLQIEESYDDEYGGFSIAPKFPRPGTLLFLNQVVKSGMKGNVQADKMLRTTLDAMADGGIYDQLAGGFHRYSVDQYWQVPHFEKMLYSQALMVLAYSDYYRINPREKYKQVVFDSLTFVMAEMQSPAGGFYSALDADSERHDEPGVHAEGAYYLWRLAELKEILSSAEFELVEKYYQTMPDGNIASDPNNEFSGLNILYVDEALRGEMLDERQAGLLRSAKKKLNAARKQRPRPQLDDKIITAWNGMMLSALANASIVFDEKTFLQEAIRIADFVKKNLYSSKTKKLHRQYREQSNSRQFAGEAMLSDYAWLIHGLLKLYAASEDDQWLRWAEELQLKQDAIFLDTATAAYFESAANDRHILFRSKSIYDGALPSANAIALSNLRQLSVLSEKTLQKKVYALQAEKLVGSFAGVINLNPAAASTLLAVEARGEPHSKGNKRSLGIK